MLIPPSSVTVAACSMKMLDVFTPALALDVIDVIFSELRRPKRILSNLRLYERFNVRCSFAGTIRLSLISADTIRLKAPYLAIKTANKSSANTHDQHIERHQHHAHRDRVETFDGNENAERLLNDSYVDVAQNIRMLMCSNTRSQHSSMSKYIPSSTRSKNSSATPHHVPTII